jgi:hypothetical protein
MQRLVKKIFIFLSIQVLRPQALPAISWFSRNSPYFRREFFAPDFLGELVIMIMINLLTTLTGFWFQFIMILSNLALSSASAPFLGLLLLSVGKTISHLKGNAPGVDFSQGGTGGTPTLFLGGTPMLPEDLSQGCRIQPNETSR